MPSFAPQAAAAAPIGLASLDDDALDARLLAGRYRGDPIADRLVEVFAALPGRTGWRMLDAALADGIDAVPEAPPELRALLADATDLPPWLDLDLVDAGAMSFWRAGAPTLAVALVYGSLAFGYQFADLSRPLAATGRLERMASRRIGRRAAGRWPSLLPAGCVRAARAGAAACGCGSCTRWCGRGCWDRGAGTSTPGACRSVPPG